MTEQDQSARWHDQFLIVHDAMAEEVRPFVVAFASLRGDLIGSGLLARRGGSHFVLTAGHVVRDLQSDLDRDELALVTNARKGHVPIPRGAQLAGRYEPEATPYFDAGVVRLEPTTAATINSWTLNRWFPLDLPIDTRPIDEDGRIFFATGFPAAFVDKSETPTERRLSARYTYAAWHAHPRATVAGALAFEMARDRAIDPYSGGSIDLFSLRGLSGAPLWTFDISDSEKSIRLIGVHSASSGDTAVAVHLRQHRELLSDLGWW